jgi:hypothetical protein
MNRFRVLPASGRRSLVIFGMTMALVGSLTANLPASARQTPQEDPFKFSIDTPIMIVAAIKPAVAADFQAGWAMVKSEFESSTRPEVKEFGATITKFYKVDPALVGKPATAEAPVTFIFQIDAPSKTLSYSPTAILYALLWKNGEEGGIARARADEIWAKLEPAYKEAQIAIWPLTKLG